MRIIIEWCDKSGKTTLVNYLKERFECKVVKFSQPKTDEPFNEYLEHFWIKNENEIEICDRSWIWQYIYWPIYRWQKAPKKEIKKLDKLWLENNDIIIYCQTDKWIVKKNFLIDKEKFTNIKDIWRIQRNFVKVISKLKTNKIWFDYRLNNLEDIWNIIDMQIELNVLRKVAKELEETE